MRLLLDTHVLIWMALEPERLSRRAARELDRTVAERWISPLSIWELVNLREKGRFAIQEPTGVWLEKTMMRASLREAPLSLEIALATEQAVLPHGDPIDRFLVATARLLDLTLVTADQRLIEAAKCRILEAR